VPNTKPRRKKSETLVASVAPFDAEGRLLFGLRIDCQRWTTPGGHLEEGEDPEDAARRELREEAGLEAEDLEFLGHGVVRREAGNIRVFAYRAKVKGTPHGDNDPDQECQTWRFVDVSGGLPTDIVDHLYSKNNVTLRLLGLQPGEIRKFLPSTTCEGEGLNLPAYADVPGLSPREGGDRVQDLRKVQGQILQELGLQGMSLQAEPEMEEQSQASSSRIPAGVGDASTPRSPGDRQRTQESSVHGLQGIVPVVRDGLRPLGSDVKDLERLPDGTSWMATHASSGRNRQVRAGVRELSQDQDTQKSEQNLSFGGEASSASTENGLQPKMLRKDENPNGDLDLAQYYATPKDSDIFANLRDANAWHPSWDEPRNRGMPARDLAHAERQRQLNLWHALREPTHSDVDHAMLHPDPVQRSLAPKMPGFERRHLLRALHDPALQGEALKSPLVDGGVISEVLSDPKVMQWPYGGKLEMELLRHPAADASHVRQSVDAGHMNPEIFSHPKMDAATLLHVFSPEKFGDYPENSPELIVGISKRDWSKLHPDTLHGIAAAWSRGRPGSIMETALNFAIEKASQIRPDTARLILDHRKSRPEDVGPEVNLASNPNTPPEALTEMANHLRFPAGQLAPENIAIRTMAAKNPNLPTSSFDSVARDPSPGPRAALARQSAAGRLSPEQEVTLARDSYPLVLMALAETSKNASTLRELHGRLRGDAGLGDPENRNMVASHLYRNKALPNDVTGDLLQSADAGAALPRDVHQLLYNPNVSDDTLRRVLALPAQYYDQKEEVLDSHVGRRSREGVEHLRDRVKPEWLDPLVDSPDPKTKALLVRPSGTTVATPEQTTRMAESASAMAHQHVGSVEGRHLAEATVRAINGGQVAPEAVKRIALAPETVDTVRSTAIGKSRFQPAEMLQLNDWLNKHGSDNFDFLLARHQDTPPDMRLRIMDSNPAVAYDVFEHHSDVLTPKEVEWGLTRNADTSYGNVAAAAVGHRHATPEMVERLANFDDPNASFTVARAAIRSGKLSHTTLAWLANSERDFPVLGREARETLARESPNSVFKERVAAKLGTGKLRKVRDLILASGRPSMHPRELPPGDWSAGRGPDGNIHADRLQTAIDAASPLEYNVSHDTWSGGQRHSNANSKVFQVNVTDDQIKRMKESGVYGTFRKMQQASGYSGHPVSTTHGIGWVRYTGSPKSGFFVDEVQSDFGQSFVRQAAAQAKERGEDERAMVAQAQKEYPEEHFQAISKILFGGKHPNEVLHETFQQHLRDRGHHNAKVAVHTVESKAPISLGRTLPRKCKHCEWNEQEHRDGLPTLGHNFVATYPSGPMFGPCLKEGCGKGQADHQTHKSSHEFEPGEVDRTKAPGHFNVTYHDVPKKMGMEPSTYGKLRTEANKEMKGRPTWSGTVRKSERSSATLVGAVRSALTDDLRKPRYRGNPNPVAGHCYVASEALYHLMGGAKSGYTPCSVRHEGDVHWYLRGPGGKILDATAEQFKTPPPYHLGRGRGFLTAAPSARAAQVIARVGGRTRKFEGDLHAWLAGLPLAKMAVDPAQLKGVARYHMPSGGDYVDDSQEGAAHPKQHEHLSGLFQTKVLGSNEIVKRSKFGEHPTGKAIYDVQDDQGGDHRFMVKPYHEKVTPRTRSWMRHPIQGWAEMTNQTLFHAAGIGDMHQKVHVARVPMAEHGRPPTAHGRQEMADGVERPPQENAALVVHMRPGFIPVGKFRDLKQFSEVERQQAKKIGVMDFLSNNLDRHTGNLLLNPETGKMLAIDHSRNFQYRAPTKWGWDGREPDMLSNYFTTRDEETALDHVDPPMRPVDDPDRWDVPEAHQRSEAGRHIEEWKPVMEWWEKNSGPVRRAMASRLKLVKDPKIREHVARNFAARADHLDGLARMLDAGVEPKSGYSGDWWWNAPVQFVRPEP
jgi:ADP-ribose pyrophosphatase YjhB (NUDIX family)